MDEADWMVEAMRNERTDQDVISEVAGYIGMSGLTSLRKSLPEG